MVETDPEDTCAAQHVQESDEIKQIIQQVVLSLGSDAAVYYRRFNQIVSKYQEQSQLLDPILEELIKPSAALIYRLAMDLEVSDRMNTVNETSRYLWLLASVRGYKVVLRFFPNEVAYFEPVVALLQRLRSQEATEGGAALLWEAEYVMLLWLSILVLVPFHLSILDSSLSHTAGAADAPVAHAAAAQAPPPQEPTVAAAGAAQVQQQHPPSVSYPPIVASIVAMCNNYLGSAGSVREMAAVVLGRLLTRPDLGIALEEWVELGCAAMVPWRGPGGGPRWETGGRGSPEEGFKMLGAALTFCTIFKLGKREALLDPAVRVMPAAAELLGSPAAASNALARKLAVKLVQRIGLTFLRPRLAAWRYQKGRSVLLGRAGGIAKHAQQGTEQQMLQGGGVGEGEEEEAEEDVQHAELIEDVIEALLTGLGDRDTVVRWCAAKGLGRVTGRLPRDLADDVVASVVGSFFTPGASDTAWHGGCLAVAELARRGLLLPDRLPEVAPLIMEALVYDVRRGPCSVGAHVRDAAAYVCWAFARAYTPDTLAGVIPQLAPALMSLACLDREVNCRKAAAAAFQECVGRLGTVPHGIQVLTAADYFTVSVRSSAYLTVGPTVASYPEYFGPLADHLLTRKLQHWEKALRELAAQALAALVPHNPSFFLTTALPTLLSLVTNKVMEVRHGAVAAIAELLPALRDQGVDLGRDLEDSVGAIVPSMDAARVTVGKGGEVVRTAICRLIQTTSMVGIPLSPTQRTCLYQHTLNNLHHASPDIQRCAQAALAAFARRYLPSGGAAQGVAGGHCTGGQDSPPDASDSLEDSLELSTRRFLRDMEEAQGGLPARRGSVLALAALPCWLLLPLRDEVVTTLADACQVEGVPTELQDADTRVNAVRALGHVTRTLHSLPGQSSAAGFEAGEAAAGEGGALTQLVVEDVEQICSTAVQPLLMALTDYSTDNRGDVGSWVREASMEELHSVLLPLLRQLPAVGGGASPTLPPALSAASRQTLHALLRQSVERISRVREAAAAALQSLLPAAVVAGVPGAACMASALCELPLEDFMTGEALGAVAALLAEPSLQHALLEGLAFSIGGLDAQLSSMAADALEAGVKQVEAAAAAAAADGDVEGRRLQALAELGKRFAELWEGAQQAQHGQPCTAEPPPQQLQNGGVAAPQRGRQQGATCGGGGGQRARLATPLLAAADVLLSRTALREALQQSPAVPTSHLQNPLGGREGQAVQPAAPPDSGCTARHGAGLQEGKVQEDAVGAGAGEWASSLGERLLACVRREVKGCTDIPRLHLAACVLCQLAELPPPVQGEALAAAIALLANRYPKVRRDAAEQLYTALLMLDPGSLGVSDPSLPSSPSDTCPPPPDMDAALEVLEATAWDGPMDAVQPARSQLCRHLGLPEPQLRGAGGAPAGGGVVGGGAAGPPAGVNPYQAFLDRTERGL